MRYFTRFVEGLTALLFSIACLCTGLLVLLTVSLVASRYVFGVSLVALHELQWHLFAAIFLLAAPETFRIDKHVRVDVLYVKCSPYIRRVIDIFGTLAFLIPMSAVLIYYGYHHAMQSRGYPAIVPVDFYSQYWFGKSGFLHEISATIEWCLRSTILMGEGSPDPGGLEARWLVKALVPVTFSVMLLQAVVSIFPSSELSEEVDSYDL